MQWTTLEVEGLQSQIRIFQKQNKIPNWDQISHEIKRTCIACKNKAVQMGFVAKRIKSHWSEEDKAKLQELIQKNTVSGQVQWKNFMKEFPGKTDRRLYQYARKSNYIKTDNNQKSRYWTNDQKQKLHRLIIEQQQIEKINWNYVASNFDVMTQVECENAAKRFKFIAYDQALWKESEQQLLIDMITKLKGQSKQITRQQWQDIANMFTNRTANACRTEAYKINVAKPFLQIRKIEKVSFSQLENLHLLLLQQGEEKVNWTVISQIMNMTPRRCYLLAYHNHLLTYPKYNLTADERQRYQCILKRSIRRKIVQWGMVYPHFQALLGPNVSMFRSRTAPYSSAQRWKLRQVAVQNCLVSNGVK